MSSLNVLLRVLRGKSSASAPSALIVYLMASEPACDRGGLGPFCCMWIMGA
jgi:hypothetical protein